MIGKNKSEPGQLDYSVPQGSIQGAFLFISTVLERPSNLGDLTTNRNSTPLPS